MNPPPAEVDPLRHAGARLVILDVRNRVERRHLLDWLHGAWGALKSADWVALRLSDARTEPALDSLAARIAGVDDDCLVIPARVAWRIPRFDAERTLRLRDLVFGDPRLPGALRARVILATDRRRAQCLLGAPATLGDLRARFVAEGGDAGNPLAFAGFVARAAVLAGQRAEQLTATP